jgi:hypothetical protein
MKKKPATVQVLYVDIVEGQLENALSDADASWTGRSTKFSLAGFLLASLFILTESLTKRVHMTLASEVKIKPKIIKPKSPKHALFFSQLHRFQRNPNSVPQRA